jgi:TolB-like protein/Tfp pilus assembly protein PilF
MSSDVSSIYSQDKINSPKLDNGGIYEFENFRLDAAHVMLYKDEKPISLAPKVIETLVALVERSGEVVSKNELMNRLWADSFVEESNLTQNIYLLRRTLGKGADGRDLIETFRRRGYRFTGAIKLRAENATATKPEEASTNLPAIERSEQPNAFDSLAVLPFKNESSDEAAEYLSDGITESIINRLSQLEDFRVLARNTVFRYKNSEIDEQQIGRDLSVSAILTGRILQFGEKLIVRTELVDAINGWQIWGEQYDRHFSDVLELQETIAREISEKLELNLSREEKRRLAKRDTKSSEAYGFYVKGRYFLNKRRTETIEQATVYFEKAIELDSAYALAYVGLADCYPLLSLYGKLTPREAYPKAETAARKALEIDDRLAEAYNSLGVVKLFYEWDWTGAENAFQKAIALNPNYADAHQRYGMFLTALGRFDEAIGEFEKAIRLDPLSLIIKTISGYPFYYARRFEEAAKRFSEVIAADANYSMAHFRLGLTRAQLGEFGKSIAEFEKSIVLSNDRDSIAAFAYAQGLAGNREKAVAALAELDEREKKGFVTSYNRALIKIGLGDYESALDWLEKALEERSYWLIYLKLDPALDVLRGNPRFAALQKEIFGAPKENIETLPEIAEMPDAGSTEKSFFSLNWQIAAVVLGLLLVMILSFIWFYRR